MIYNIFIKPMEEAFDFFKKPIKIIWGTFLIGSTVFITVGVIAHYYYKYIDVN